MTVPRLCTAMSTVAISRFSARVAREADPTAAADEFAALAAGTGVRYARVTDADGIATVLATPPHGIELVEAVVDRSQRRTLNAAITGLAARL